MANGRSSFQLSDEELTNIISRFRQGVEIRDRFRGFHRFPKSFAANQGIEWLATRALPSVQLKRATALEIAREIQARGVIVNLSRAGESIRDDTSLFRFDDHKIFHEHSSFSGVSATHSPVPASPTLSTPRQEGNFLRKWRSTTTLVPQDDPRRLSTISTGNKRDSFAGDALFPTAGSASSLSAFFSRSASSTTLPRSPTSPTLAMSTTPRSPSTRAPSTWSTKDPAPSISRTSVSASRRPSTTTTATTRADSPAPDAHSPSGIIESVVDLVDTAMEPTPPLPLPELRPPPIPTLRTRPSVASLRSLHYPLPVGHGTAAAAAVSSQKSLPRTSPPPMSFAALLSPHRASVLEGDDLMSWAIGEWDKRLNERDNGWN
ncbi:hypothetical protein M427DRAFT_27124 [Gonapodya prolifera JEL478]|uniref:DEP domain-containing protein n=1 Tax=Gonapodya prolifera (strain JEL478) TaxID=1344416 RepID=A0A139AYE1_GONPJ|nr:hypothetical protein M427DRAFT_27124 [Gonapodya prolifera JEL478]|eukprot:KXS21465.1 hypothetical protein M427DRAFT_27124 [Gonapodya prolifera JEL478]